MNIFWRNRHVFMDQAGDGASGGGGGAAGEGGGAGAQGGGGASGGAGAGAAGTVLSAGAAGAGEGGAATDYIPEKYRVNKEDGSFDLEASARKLSEAYGNAEKRIGSGDIPPKEAKEYQVTVPDALKEVFDPGKDEGMQAFLTGAHEAGLTQKQLDFVMGKYFELAPQLAAGAAQYDTNTCTEELKQTWATDADFKRNVRNAYVATEAIGQKAGIAVDDILAGPLGNNPQFLKLMAAIGPEFAEDAPPGGQQMASQEDVQSLMQSEAYTNPKHPDHAKVSEKIRKYYERKHGTEAAA